MRGERERAKKGSESKRVSIKVENTQKWKEREVVRFDRQGTLSLTM